MRVVRLGRGDSDRVLGAAELFDHPPDVRAVRAYLADRRNVLLLAYQGAVPIGFLRGTALLQLDSAQPQMFLYEIGVSRRFRRSGVGRALIHRLLTICRERGFEEVFVLTSPSNRAAVRLYRSTGGRTETTSDRMFVYDLAASASRPRRGSRRTTRRRSRRPVTR